MRGDRILTVLVGAFAATHAAFVAPSVDITIYKSTSQTDALCSASSSVVTVRNGTCLATPAYNSFFVKSLNNMPRNLSNPCLLLAVGDACVTTVANGTSRNLLNAAVFSDSYSASCKPARHPANSDKPELVGHGFTLLCRSASSADLLKLFQQLDDALKNLYEAIKLWQQGIAAVQAQSKRALTADGLRQRFNNFRGQLSSASSIATPEQQRFVHDASGWLELEEIDSQAAVNAFQALETLNNQVSSEVGTNGIPATAGKVSLAEDAIVTGLFALGIFHRIKELLTDYESGAQAPPSSSPTATVTTPPPSYTPPPPSQTSCPGASPKPTYVVLTTQDSTRKQYDDLIHRLPAGALVEEAIFDAVNYRAFLAKLSKCDLTLLLIDPIISTISLNALAADNGVKSEASTSKTKKGKKRDHPLPESRDFNEVEISKRDVTSTSIYVTQEESQNCLRWLSTLSAKRGLRGTYYGLDEYLYNKDPGFNKTRIYVVDTGVNIAHQDFNGKAGISYDATNPNNPINTQTDDDTDEHGTCMASVAAGLWAGVSKKSDIVPVKIVGSGTQSPSLFTVIRAFGFIVNDASTGSPTALGFGAVSMSFGFDPLQLDPNNSGLPDAVVDPFLDIIIGRLPGLGLVPVASAGNNAADGGKGADLNGFTPRRHGGTDSPLIVVGNAQLDGTRSGPSNYVDTSGNNILSIYAMGVQNYCASQRQRANRYQPRSGTSPATAQVAGIVAYYLSQPRIRAQFMQNGLGGVAAAAKAYLRSTSLSQKGNWPDNVPRAVLDDNLACSNPVQAPIPTPSYEDVSQFVETSPPFASSTIAVASSFLNPKPTCYNRA